MLRRFLLGTTMALVAATAGASEPASYAGFYTNNRIYEITADLTVKSGNTYDVALSTTLPMEGDRPGCGGSIAGEITVTGQSTTMKVANEGFFANEPESLANARFCEIRMTFLDAWTIKIEEVGGCGYYHGAACSFDAVVESDAKGI